MKEYVWDPVVRIFHWSLVVIFTALAVFIDPEGQLHVQLGYVIVALIMLRVAWGFVGTRHARFRDFPPSLPAAMGQLRDIATGRPSHQSGHTPLGALMIYNLIATILLIGLTGYLMLTPRFFGSEFMYEAHDLLVTWAEISVLIHIAAVIWESMRSGVNLPRAMISGYKTYKDKTGD